MNNPSETVRKFMLDQLESGRFAPGKRLPGSRKIAEELNISRPVVKNALDTMVNEGILKAAERSGLYVENEWQDRQIRGSLRVFTSDPLPWLDMFQSEMAKIQPGLHITTRFRSCPLEITTTVFAQAGHDEFIDLMPFLKDCFPDLTPFYAEQLQPFIRNGRLSALPFVFSPRLIALNRKMLREAGCDEPSPGWLVSDLVKLTERLRKKFPPERILSRRTTFFAWINFVLSCGGSLFDPENHRIVAFDSPGALAGFRAAKALNPRPKGPNLPLEQSAMAIIDRQTYRRFQHEMQGDWLFLPVPGDTHERTGISMQATELFAVRRNNLDQALIAPIIRFLWSEKFQDHLAALRYGIPIRKRSAEKSFVSGQMPDPLFKRYCPMIRNDYQLSERELMMLICLGVDKILSREGDVDREIADLADTVRKYIEYRYE